jgi:hypothetical protein
MGPGKAQRVQIKRTNEGIEETHGIFRGDIILQRFGKEKRLGAVQARAMVHA